MIVGFTGSREGMTSAQRCVVAALLIDAAEGHHGDCQGADEEFHTLCRELLVPIVLHPPQDPKWRAYSRGAARVCLLKPYLKRNRDIVVASDLLIGAPKETVEPKPARGQGTWSTIRLARKLGVQRVVVVWPDGAIR